MSEQHQPLTREQALAAYDTYFAEAVMFHEQCTNQGPFAAEARAAHLVAGLRLIVEKSPIPMHGPRTGFEFRSTFVDILLELQRTNATSYTPPVHASQDAQVPTPQPPATLTSAFPGQMLHAALP